MCFFNFLFGLEVDYLTRNQLWSRRQYRGRRIIFALRFGYVPEYRTFDSYHKRSYASRSALSVERCTRGEQISVVEQNRLIVPHTAIERRRHRWRAASAVIVTVDIGQSIVHEYGSSNTWRLSLELSSDAFTCTIFSVFCLLLTFGYLLLIKPAVKLHAKLGRCHQIDITESGSPSTLCSIVVVAGKQRPIARINFVENLYLDSPFGRVVSQYG